MLGPFIKKPDMLPWEKWRRGWDTHAVSFGILPSFQRHP